MTTTTSPRLPIIKRRPGPFRLGLDLDGVLCDFTRAFLQACAHVTGRPCPPDYVQRTWSDWADYKESEVQKAWEYTQTPYWWERLAPLNDPSGMTVKHLLVPLWRRPDKLEVTFITTRPAFDARTQSINWLLRHGMSSPQVLVAPNAAGKAALCHTLKLDVFVDDFWSNLQAIERGNVTALERHGDAVHTVHTVLYQQPWNEPYHGHFRTVEGLPSLLTAIENWAELPSFTRPSRAGELPAAARRPL